jgi:protein gp37
MSKSLAWWDLTFNPWIGCTKVSDACFNCYAEDENQFRGWVAGWGPGIPRHRTAAGYWRQPLIWNQQAARTGYRPRIFSGSLCDIFDNEVPGEWRADLWQLMRDTPLLRWMLTTKRIGNARKMLPADWPFLNAGIIATLENQTVWDRDFPKLMAVAAVWHGVSAEPLLSPIDIGDARPDWLIAGGESGPHHRHTDPDWIRSLRDQCARNGVAFFFKQWGGVQPGKAGCRLDGVEHKEFPAALIDAPPPARPPPREAAPEPPAPREVGAK